jgi:hypothetical protein
MNDDAIVRILGFWELAKKRNVDIGPIGACTISDLLNIIAKDQGLRKELGYNSKNKIDNITGAIPKLRNSIMHSVRPLVTSQEDVVDIKKTVENIIELAASLENFKDKNRL